MKVQKQDASESSIQATYPSNDLKNLWVNWFVSLSRSIQPIFFTVIVFAAYLGGDYLVIWLAGFAFSEFINDVPFIRFLYEGIKILSIIVITLHFFIEYVTELNKERKSLPKIFGKPAERRENKDEGEIS